MNSVALFPPLSQREPDVLRELDIMLQELESTTLEVMLVPQRRFTNHGGMIRCAVSKNATWYREFCAQFASSRIRKKAAFDTRIKRRNTVRTLNALLRGVSRSSYGPYLLSIARRRLANAARVTASVGGAR